MFPKYVYNKARSEFYSEISKLQTTTDKESQIAPFCKSLERYVDMCDDYLNWLQERIETLERDIQERC